MKHRDSSIILHSILIISFLFLCQESLFGQFYQTIDPSRTYYYETYETNMFTYGNLSNAIPNNKKWGLGLQVDSVIQQQNGTTYNFENVLRNIQTGGGHLCPGDSWIGPKSDVLSNGDTFFLMVMVIQF